MSLVEARNLTKRFSRFVAVDDLSFRVDSGEVVGLLGANGAGKTTTMKMLLGLLAPTSGEVLIGGTPGAEADRRLVGYVPQGLGLYRDLTVLENLQFVASAFGVEPPSPESEGLGEVANRRVGSLSLGLRRRAAFVASRCHDPRVLILDEPTSGVGPLGRARLWETIHETASAGAAVLVSTHYMDEAEECDRVVLMASGREVASGTVGDVVSGARSLALEGDIDTESADELRRHGAKVFLDAGGWRVVGMDKDVVRSIVGPDTKVIEVPASFEEAFVALSS
ncbi:MAG: ABC transporter ATP-binding protein [Acidimicrobiia bacterium]|jgi:ABC-2 type transport system ATP-binding protein/ribosome-dependent ATPase